MIDKMKWPVLCVVVQMGVGGGGGWFVACLQLVIYSQSD